MRLTDDLNPHDVACLLKEYLRCLPEPLISKELYNFFLHTRSEYLVALPSLTSSPPAAADLLPRAAICVLPVRVVVATLSPAVQATLLVPMTSLAVQITLLVQLTSLAVQITLLVQLTSLTVQVKWSL